MFWCRLHGGSVIPVKTGTDPTTREASLPASEQSSEKSEKAEIFFNNET